MNKMLDHGETRLVRSQTKASPFVSAAGLVLGIGLSVLGLIARAIRAAASLLTNPKATHSSRVSISDKSFNQQRIGNNTNLTKTVQDFE